MKISELIEKHFWLILLAGILIGIWAPVRFKAPPFLPKVLLGIMPYLVFLLLHIIGYLICPKENKENRIAVAIGAAFMNNGMAIVLAASYFKPEILVLMVLSEIPWNTLLAPFKKVARLL